VVPKFSGIAPRCGERYVSRTFDDLRVPGKHRPCRGVAFFIIITDQNDS